MWRDPKAPPLALVPRSSIPGCSLLEGRGHALLLSASSLAVSSVSHVTGVLNSVSGINSNLMVSRGDDSLVNQEGGRITIPSGT